MDINEGLSGQKRCHGQIEEEVVIDSVYSRRKLDTEENLLHDASSKKLHFAGSQQVKDDLSPPASLENIYSHEDGSRTSAAIFSSRTGPNSLQVEIGSTSSKTTNAKGGEDAIIDQI